MYKVEGYLFESEAEAIKAQKEANRIRYIKEQTAGNDPETMLKLYKHMIEQNLFHTVVGISYLHEIQRDLSNVPYIAEEDILPIPIEATLDKKQLRQVLSKNEQKASAPLAETEKHMLGFKITSFLCVVLSLALVGIFVITAVSGKSTTILNYEQQILDKYESWENDLKEREEIIREKEKELNL